MRAILPDLIKFAYIPRNQLRITEEISRGRKSPDYSSCSGSTSTSTLENEEDHVLVLEFVDNVRGTKTKGNRFLSSAHGAQDPVVALRIAADTHIPINPSCDPDIVRSVHDFRQVPSSGDRPSIDSIVTELEEQSWCKGRITYKRSTEAKDATNGSKPCLKRTYPLIQSFSAMVTPPLSPPIAQALLGSRQITSLYSHQATAIHALARRRHVIVSTSTASGKSVIYQVPTLQFLEADPHSTAIFVFPTKVSLPLLMSSPFNLLHDLLQALAQDQKASMEQLVSTCPGLQHLKVATYDGDTPPEVRPELRESSSVIFTNFDTIHASILPHEDLWRRICAALGNRHILFVSCSATIGNPGLHMSRIFGLPMEDVEVVIDDGGPTGAKTSLVWKPSLINELVPSLGHHSSLTDATGLMRFLMKRGVRVILFYTKGLRTRRCSAMKTLRSDLSSEGRYDILERTMPYRGGYSREDRRKIEQDAFNGRLLGIVATNALELGVDIGALDAVIMLGFPMTVASFRQQAGRAGRRSRDSLAVLVADPFPIDQYYIEHPEELFDRAADDLLVDLESKPLLEGWCSRPSHEMPLSSEDRSYFGPQFEEICNMHLRQDQHGWYHAHPKFLPFPSKFISIRGAQEDKYAVINVTKTEESGQPGSILEEVEVSRSMFELYEGGVVKHVLHDSKVAHVVRADVNWLTSPRDFTQVLLLCPLNTTLFYRSSRNVNAVQTHRIKEIKGSSYRAYYGKVDVEVMVFGFFKIRNKVILEAVDLDTPAWHRETTGLWIDVPKTLLQLFLLKGINPAEAIHAAQHAVLNQFSMGQDLRTECKAAEKEYTSRASRRKRPARLILYDAIGQGGGVAAKALDNGVQSAACTENNLVCSKLGALLAIRCIIGLDIDPDDVSSQEGQDFETVVEAETVHVMDGVEVESS
ncbi:hypothetical protein H0H93_009302 [Arthromyces matolae]|nr:hypothetical protein H0H93_009302 [Arthromyces matolae]